MRLGSLGIILPEIFSKTAFKKAATRDILIKVVLGYFAIFTGKHACSPGTLLKRFNTGVLLWILPNF